MPITINTTTELDVVEKQRELVAEALSPEGIYIRMKDTLEELVNKGELKKSPDAAKVVAETIASMANSITTNAMGTALQWEAQEKGLALQKAELEYRLELLANQVKESEQSQESTLANRNLAVARTIRDYGTYVTNVDGEIVSLNDDGRLYTEEQNVAKQGVVLDSQILMEGYKEDVMLATKQDKIDSSGFESNKKASELAVVQGTQAAKISQATAQLNKTNQETDYIGTQEAQLVASVEYNNKIKAVNALGQTYGTFGAGGLTVSSDMWNVYFGIVSDLSTASLPTDTDVTKVT